MGRPRTHGTDTEALLLTAAGKLLATEGSQAVSVRRLADEAGVTTRAVYSLFGDKSGLLRALFRQMAETMRRYHEAVPVLDDPVAEITELALAYRSAALEEANLYSLYLGRAVPDLALDPQDLAVAFRSFDRVLAALVRCAEAGRLGGHDPQDATHELWALVHGLASLELGGFLGATETARRRWVEAVSAVMAGFGHEESARAFP